MRGSLRRSLRRSSERCFRPRAVGRRRTLWILAPSSRRGRWIPGWISGGFIDLRNDRKCKRMTVPGWRGGAGPMVCETYFLLPSGHAVALCLLLETRGPSTHAHTTNTQRSAHPRTCVCAELRAAIAAVRLQPRAAIAAIDRGSPGQGHLGKNPPPRWAFYRTGLADRNPTDRPRTDVPAHRSAFQLPYLNSRQAVCCIWKVASSCAVRTPT